MKAPRLGQEIRRYRLKSDATLRGFSSRLGVSAAHLSDIEHDRRRPSAELLHKIADELGPVGATFESFDLLITGIDPETREWLAATPGLRKILRMMRESESNPQELFRALEKTIERLDKRSNGK